MLTIKSKHPRNVLLCGRKFGYEKGQNLSFSEVASLLSTQVFKLAVSTGVLDISHGKEKVEGLEALEALLTQPTPEAAG
jgi:hypothetical protein